VYSLKSLIVVTTSYILVVFVHTIMVYGEEEAQVIYS